MRIAQIAPLYESCPPQLYGGTERVVSWLTEELVRRGHRVTLFASGDSRTSAELRSACPRALRLDSRCRDPLPHHLAMLHRVARAAGEFDLLHFHTEYLHLPLFAQQRQAVLTTLHGRLDLCDLDPIFNSFGHMPLVAISAAQRAARPRANWLGTVHHGLPLDLHGPGRGAGGYLAFLGRISPEKRIDRAVEIAIRSGMPLRIAAKVDPQDADYFRSVRHLLEHPLVEHLGEIGEREKSVFLGGAAALLFPVDWPEPFGLAMIEAMAAGTPVVAWRNGAVAEVVDAGVTGYVVDSLDQAAHAVSLALRLDRAAVRRRFEQRFAASRMAADYERLYEAALNGARGRMAEALAV